MNFNLTRPCNNCPFLKENGIRLMAARVRQIAGDALHPTGRTFACHKTTIDNDDGDPSIGRSSSHCAGSLLFSIKHDHQTQLMQIAERLGLYKPEKLVGHEKVFDNMEQMLKTALDRTSPRRRTPRRKG